ncbi:unnamed protein product [Darwinula stevensoni]|uniref:Ig-like domain-containing protein n=1 Tax=Darwinula stevensoni TaxID=69355 RepID=A0A7R9FQH4_9CRUS|nr:unnamed protein product [Darwinula stevensoni]CAG0899167.1 unnamed protein product [Darwinula stevensoni]
MARVLGRVGMKTSETPSLEALTACPQARFERHDSRVQPKEPVFSKASSALGDSSQYEVCKEKRTATSQLERSRMDFLLHGFPTFCGKMNESKFLQPVSREREDYTIRHVLRLHGVVASDYGGYTCFARNELGDASATLQIYEVERRRTTQKPKKAESMMIKEQLPTTRGEGEPNSASASAQIGTHFGMLLAALCLVSEFSI